MSEEHVTEKFCWDWVVRGSLSRLEEEIGCGVGVVIRGVASVDGLGGKIGGVFEKGAWFGIAGCLTVFPHPFS